MAIHVMARKCNDELAIEPPVQQQVRQRPRRPFSFPNGRIGRDGRRVRPHAAADDRNASESVRHIPEDRDARANRDKINGATPTLA